ncbi:hypothetical protein C483_09274 [Natrialba hulunbeirensis JCM 10989]|uniref:Uncharacterized protein n=1 Tax=Natrialba hulunbeirensis JCM 10989 TaxID=1227493 RepID=L9ZYX6_9EURY|nr:hypothetical protein C483_09274 [Natrialba hulunbeirensis JCM 10989]
MNGVGGRGQRRETGLPDHATGSTRNHAAGRDSRGHDSGSGYGHRSGHDHGHGHAHNQTHSHDRATDHARRDLADIPWGDESVQFDADVDRIVERLYRRLDRKQRIERERRGL